MGTCVLQRLSQCSYLFFFFKQKTAYEMSASLVGSEMCIRDRTTGVSNQGEEEGQRGGEKREGSLRK